MNKNKPVDYEKAVQKFEKNQRGPVLNKTKSLRATVTPDGGVDYVSISKAYEKMQIVDQSEVVHNESNADVGSV